MSECMGQRGKAELGKNSVFKTGRVSGWENNKQN